MIEKIDQEQISDTAGIIVFHLVDDNGSHRSVRGSTFLNEDKEPQGVTAENVRELPLIENLFSNRHKKFIEIEFDHFNEVYHRETDQTINQIAYEAVKNMQREKTLSQRLTNFLRRA